MYLAVLLVFDCHLNVEEIRSFTKQKVIFEMEPHTGAHLLLSKKQERIRA